MTTIIYDSKGEEHGTTTGGKYPCRLDGCTGQRIGVRWPDGSITFPCSQGLKYRDDGHLQIM